MLSGSMLSLFFGVLCLTLGVSGVDWATLSGVGDVPLSEWADISAYNLSTIPSTAFYSFNSTILAAVNPLACSGFTAAQCSGMYSRSFAGWTAACVANLNDMAWSEISDAQTPYLPLDILPSIPGAVIRNMARGGLQGLNMTIPQFPDFILSNLTSAALIENLIFFGPWKGQDSLFTIHQLLLLVGIFNTSFLEVFCGENYFERYNDSFVLQFKASIGTTILYDTSLSQQDYENCCVTWIMTAYLNPTFINTLYDPDQFWVICSSSGGFEDMMRGIQPAMAAAMTGTTIGSIENLGPKTLIENILPDTVSGWNCAQLQAFAGYEQNMQNATQLAFSESLTAVCGPSSSSTSSHPSSGSTAATSSFDKWSILLLLCPALLHIFL